MRETLAYIVSHLLYTKKAGRALFSFNFVLQISNTPKTTAGCSIGGELSQGDNWGYGKY